MKRLKEIWNKDTLLMHSYYNKDIDTLCVVTKSATTGKKTIHNIKEPLVPIYIINKDVDVTNYLDHARYADQVTTHWVPEKYRVYAIADILGVKNFADKVRSGAMQSREIYLHKRLIGSDKDISDLVMRSYVEEFTQYNDEGYPVITPPAYENFHIGAFDIEADVNICPGDIEDMEARRQQPINIVTYIDNQSWEIRTIMLRNKEYKGQKEVEKDIPKFEEKLKMLIKDNIINIFSGNDSVSEKTKNDIRNILLPAVDKLKLNLTFTNSEKSLIRDISKHMFDNVNPDILYIYNAQYDLTQMKLRCEMLGLNYEKLFKYKDLPESIDFRNTDRNGWQTPDKRTHTYCMNNPTKILDQMLLYYQLRRSKTFSKYSLDATAEREIGTAKLKYPKNIVDFGDRVYYDAELFIMYNIIDVLLMIFLDMVTYDTFTIMYKRFNMITEWERIGKPMPRTTNAMDYYSHLQGYVTAAEINSILINLNDETLERLTKKNPNQSRVISDLRKAYANTQIKDKSKRDKKFVVPGGEVSSPNKISPEIKNNELFGNLNINNYNKQGLCADDDAEAMYPNNTVANNASKATLCGKIAKINDIEEPDLAQKVAMSIINKNYSSMGSMLFNLPSAEDLIEKYYNIKKVYKPKYDLNISINKENLVYNIPKEYELVAKSYITFWNQSYKTAYKDIDMQAGAPANQMKMFSDDTVIKFAYYGSKVTLTTNQPSNDWFGLSGTGFTCGKVIAKDNTIENLYDQYLDVLLPKEDPILGMPIADGMLDQSQLLALSKAKSVPCPIDFDEYKLSFLGKAIFTNYKTDIKWTIYNIDGNDKCKMLILNSDYELTKTDSIHIEQRIIFYNMRGE